MSGGDGEEGEIPAGVLGLMRVLVCELFVVQCGD